jgi:hypothetical protein
MRNLVLLSIEVDRGPPDVYFACPRGRESRSASLIRWQFGGQPMPRRPDIQAEPSPRFKTPEPTKFIISTPAKMGRYQFAGSKGLGSAACTSALHGYSQPSAILHPIVYQSSCMAHCRPRPLDWETARLAGSLSPRLVVDLRSGQPCFIHSVSKHWPSNLSLPALLITAASS